MHRIALAVVSLLLVANPAVAQAPTAPAAPAPSADEAGALLAKAQAAVKATKDLSATIETKVTSEGQISTIRARLQVVFTSELFPFKAWRYELPAKDGAEGLQSTVSGIGDRIYQLRPADKELVELDLKGLPPMPQDATFLLPLTWYISERNDGAMFPGMPKPKVSVASLDGEREVGGVRCRVLKITRETSLGSAGAETMTLHDELTVALGVDDALPRHVRSVLTQTAGDTKATQETETTFTEVKTNLSPSDETFRLKTPEGYKHRVDSSEPEAQAPQLAVKAGDAAPDFRLKDLAGTERTLADFKGKVLVLDFWASWCGPCKEVMPTIQAIHEHFKGKPVEVLGVNIGERTPDAGTAYLKGQSFTYGCLLGGDELAKTCGIRLIPTIIVIGPDGRIRLAQSGVSPDEREMLIGLISDALPK